MSTNIYAGHLCGTHVGEWITVGEVTGWCHVVIHSREHAGPRVIVMSPDGYRDDGSLRKRSHDLRLDPRDVVAVGKRPWVDERAALSHSG